MNPKYIEKAKIKLRENEIGKYFTIIKYNGYTQKSIFYHKECGNEFETRFDHLLDRKTCLYCSGRKRNIERFQEKSNEVHNSEYEILELIC